MFNPSAAGQGSWTITYVFTDVNGCSDSATQTISVDLCTAVQAISNESSVSINPNPSNGDFSISLKEEGLTDVNIAVMDVQGKIVYQFTDKATNDSFTKNIQLEQLAEGIYTVQVVSNLGVTNEKIVVRK